MLMPPLPGRESVDDVVEASRSRVKTGDTVVVSSGF